MGGGNPQYLHRSNSFPTLPLQPLKDKDTGLGGPWSWPSWLVVLYKPVRRQKTATTAIKHSVSFPELYCCKSLQQLEENILGLKGNEAFGKEETQRLQSPSAARSHTWAEAQRGCSLR